MVYTDTTILEVRGIPDARPCRIRTTGIRVVSRTSNATYPVPGGFYFSANEFQSSNKT